MIRAQCPRLAAYQGMSRLAGQMSDRRQNRHLDPIYADLRTCMDDYRIAFVLAIGAPAAKIDPCGGYWNGERVDEG